MTQDLAPREDVAPAVAFFDSRRITLVPGVANGLRVPGVQLLLSPGAPGDGAGDALRQGLDRMAVALGVAGPPQEEPAAATARPAFAGLCRRWALLLLAALAEVNASLSEAAAGTPSLQVLGAATGGGGRAAGHDGILLRWPTHWPQLLAPVLDWALDLWSTLAQAADEDAAVAAARSSWDQVRRRILQGLPPGTNAALLLAAADRLAVPVRWVDWDVLLVGQGRRARWLRSTMTDATPGLGAMLARDKARANRLLREAGVPVPRHEEVASEQAALAAAARLGWPVVVKPADQDGGAGARAGLSTEAYVADAYRHATTRSQRVLVEQHLDGVDHRLTVVHGHLFAAYKIRRAIIVGDGTATLQGLIDAENARRREALADGTSILRPIHLQPEDLQLLEETGWCLDATPAAGQEVTLQRMPSSSHGGVALSCFGAVHPDNRVAVERAARLLRLDVAGVDFISPDISRSWREVGGAVTEVNAIPQVYNRTDRNMVMRLLRELVPGRGRVPLAYVLTQGDAPAWVEVLRERLVAAGLCVGLTTPAGMCVGTDWIRMPRTSEWDDIRALQLDPTVGAIVVVGDGAGFLRSGLPFDTVDALVVATFAPQVLRLLLPYCGPFKAIIGEEVARRCIDMPQARAGDWLVRPEGGQEESRLVDEVTRALVAAEAFYARAEPVLPDEVVRIEGTMTGRTG